MKRIMIIMAFLASVASAHHMAQYDDAGIYIDEDSPHLDMEF